MFNYQSTEEDVFFCNIDDLIDRIYAETDVGLEVG